MTFSLLTHDSSIFGLTSPLLSWVGSLGLLLFFGWQITTTRGGSAPRKAAAWG